MKFHITHAFIFVLSLVYTSIAKAQTAQLTIDGKPYTLTSKIKPTLTIVKTDIEDAAGKTKSVSVFQTTLNDGKWALNVTINEDKLTTSLNDVLPLNGDNDDDDAPELSRFAGLVLLNTQSGTQLVSYKGKIKVVISGGNMQIEGKDLNMVNQMQAGKNSIISIQMNLTNMEVDRSLYDQK